MFSKRIVGVAALVVFALFMAGCCDKDDCKSEYSLYETREECEVAFDMPGEPSTPIIILEPSEGNSAVLAWSVNDDVVGDNSTSIFDPSVQCKLRFDFIGRKLHEFEYTDTDNTTKDGEDIYASNALVKVHIHNGNPGGAYWSIISQTDPLKSCTQVYPGPIPSTNSLPPELWGLTLSSFEGDEGAGKEGAKKFEMMTEIP